MQPFTVESINETLELLGIDAVAARAAVDRVYTAEEAVAMLTAAIGESGCGALIDLADTLDEGIDALAGPCSRCGVSISCPIEVETGGMTVDVVAGGQTQSLSTHYRPYEESFQPIVHGIEKAVHGHLRIFPLRSTYGTDTITYALLTKHDWERLLRILGAPAFDMLFVDLAGKSIV